MDERLSLGLCREFAKAVAQIINDHKINEDIYEEELIGYEIRKLFQSLFEKKDIEDLS